MNENNKKTAVKKERYAFKVLCCPVCYPNGDLQKKDSELVCSCCKKKFPVVEGIPHFLPNINAKTKLEHIDYDEVHAINEQARVKVYQQWEDIFKTYNINKGSILEVGSGTGNITASLINDSNFSQVHSCDISPKFLNSIEHNYCKTQKAKKKIHFYVCDANQLPFASKSFNVVLGHSVLHHFLDYKETIKRSYDVLKPGGLAVFYEPVIQGKILVAFFIELMLRFQEHSLKIFSNDEIKRMKKLVKHITKAKGDLGREDLAKMEDKYIFDAEELSDLAKEIGFTSVNYVNNGGIDSSAIRGYKPYVISNLLMIRIPKEKIQHFNFIFDAFAETVSDLIGEQILTPMVYLAFQK